MSIHTIEKMTQTARIIYFQVLDRAKEGESLEELRARTTAQFAQEQNGLQNSTNISKKRKHLAILDEGTLKFERSAD